MDWRALRGPSSVYGSMMSRVKSLTLRLGPTGAAGSQGPQGVQGIQGPIGPPGVQGAQGNQGNQGSTWLSGSGAPSSGTGVDGDNYLDIDTGDAYSKAAGSWSIVANLKGPHG